VSLLLLTGAGLLMRSFLLQRQTDLGIRTDHVLITQITFRRSNTKARNRKRASFATSCPASQRFPALCLRPPHWIFHLTAASIRSSTWQERRTRTAGKATWVPCTSKFFDTLHVRTLQGRTLLETDEERETQGCGRERDASPPSISVAVVRWGRQIQLTGLKTAPEPVPNPWFEIVGVVSDMKNKRDPPTNRP